MIWLSQIWNYLKLSKSLYQIILGDNFNKLHPDLKWIFGFNHLLVLEGEIEYKSYHPIFAKSMSLILNLPMKSGLYPSKLIVKENNGKQLWYRYMKDKLFQTEACLIGNLFMEKTLILETYYRLEVVNRSLIFNSLFSKVFGFLLPYNLSPRIFAINTIEDEILNARITVKHPILGRIIKYTGRFQLA